MPSVYRESQVTWNEVRPEVTSVPQHARRCVWGEGKRDVDNQPLRTAQMLFPRRQRARRSSLSYGADDGTEPRQQPS